MNSRENTLEILYVYYIVPLIELVVLNELFERPKKIYDLGEGRTHDLEINSLTP